MTKTAKKMFKDIGYKYSEKYITDNITNEKVLEQIQYEKGCETIRFYIRGKFWGKTYKNLGSKYDYTLYSTMEETEAIVQQCKELNWINNNSKTETNFEHYFEKIKELVSLYYFRPQTIANGLMAVADEDILGTDLIATNAILDWCKKPYKNRDYCLSEFEYELLESYLNSDEEAASLCIKDVKVLQNMQKKGYFQNIDWYTPIKDVLECSEIKKGGKKDE